MKAYNKKRYTEKAEMPSVCAFCDKAMTLLDGEYMLCGKYGVVLSDFKCRSFKYDPLKRKPFEPPKLPEIDPEEMKIEG